MYYHSFRIQNFKGIKDTTIKLSDQNKMGVFAFVGLNESGKTTVLEAIHSFSPDYATSQLVGNDESSGVPIKNRVPRHLISNFTGNISVTAVVKLENGDKDTMLEELQSKHKLSINPDDIDGEIIFERLNRFENGDLQKSLFLLRTNLDVKTGKQKKWRSPSNDEKVLIRDSFYDYTPDIAYFPTFVFEFPGRIFLNEERGSKVSNFYREVFQDILDFDRQGHTIEDSIIRRVRAQDKIVSFIDFFSIWSSSDDRDKIQHVMDRASSAVTQVVFGRWNEIFGEDAKGKEINISYEIIEGSTRDDSGATRPSNEHDVFIKFQIKDGTIRFDVNDRSLGFRWFFAFMLFTQFRVARECTKPILFLFDEPASNLHAAAQQKLIESFPIIAKENHTLAYTTHSHYMIEPKWLEQTFIVTNRSDAPAGSIIDAISQNDESLDIKATRYKAFVNDHPGQTSYFQPILDRLEVIPSRFDFDRKSIVVEGKSDYYVLRYAIRLLNRNELPVIPGIGAGTFGSLVSLHIGWNLKVIFLLDGDRKGKTERDRYVKDYGLSPLRVATIDELVSGVMVIEDLLDNEAMGVIAKAIGTSGTPTKNQIRRFFQESLARDEIISLGSNFVKIAGTILDKLENRLEQ